jgi:archaellum biogenesis protein FlaJ (TadC family)
VLSRLRGYVLALLSRVRSNGVIVLNLGVAVLVALVLWFYFKLGLFNVIFSIIAATLTLHLTTLPRRYEEYVRKLMVNSLLVASRGLKSSEIRALRLALMYCQVLVVALSFVTVVYTVLVGFNAFLVASTITLLCLLVVLLLLPNILVYTWSSQRKTSVEVELPYVIILLRVLSALKMPIYEILSLIESSVALSASSREIKFARKIATITRTSLLSALDRVFANHPSERVVNYLRRIITAAVTHADYSGVAEKAFDAIYAWFESRVLGLVGNFTIIVGTSLFVYLFIPVIVSAIAPVFGGGLLMILGVSLTMQVFVFFTLYASIMSLLPSSLIIKPSKRLKIASTIALVGVVSIVLYNVFSLVAGRELPVNWGYVTLGLIVGLTIPVLVLSELEFRRVVFYDMFVRVSSEALSTAAATGENPVSLLERSAVRYGKRAVRFTRTITTGYLSERLRRGIITRAPSIYHAAYLETLLAVFRLGATPEMLRLFTMSYERLSTQVSRVRGFARTLEAIMAGLVAVIGGFLAYIDRVFTRILELVREATGATGFTVPLAVPFTYDPKIYLLLDNLSLLSLLFISIFIGCVRGGSYTYSFRSFTVMLVLYIVFKTAMRILVLF